MRGKSFFFTKNILYVVILLFCLATAFLVSCGKDRTYEYEEKTFHNKWIYEMMTDVYLWADTINTEPTWSDYFLTPKDFLAKLAQKSGKDTYSYCMVDTISSDPFERGMFNRLKSYGMDFVSMTDPTGATSKLYLRVTTVYPNSPASEAGLERGMFISSFDGYKLSESNIKNLKRGIAHELDVCRLRFDMEMQEYYWDKQQKLQLPESRYVEDWPFPLFMLLGSEHKSIGYMMCTRLTERADESQEETYSYKDELDREMAIVKSWNVDDFVLDLRLCSYGTIEMARRLASYLVSPEKINDGFVSTKWNASYSANNEKMKYDASLLNGNLGLSRIYIIVGPYTQGPAEWIVAAMRKSMGSNVIVVGTQTKGQNVMTQSVGHEYGLELFPVVAYVLDGDGNEMSLPIVPDYVINENDYVEMREYGDEREVLFNKCIELLGEEER